MTATLSRLHPVTLYEAALDGADVVAVGPSGSMPLAVDVWTRDADPVDEFLVGLCEPPVLDVGCGPGRLVAALTARGVSALGIDVSAQAVARARARGAPALRRAVETALPGEGRWGSVLLADGNIGIGGHPAVLLARCRSLLGPGGVVLVEADPDPDADVTLSLELRSADGRASRPLAWARAGTRALDRLAPGCGLRRTATWHLGGRTLVALRAVAGARTGDPAHPGTG